LESIDKNITNHIDKNPRGKIFFPEDFNEYGSSGAIRITLHRLVEKGEIKRIAQGVYVKPKVSKLLGKLTPTAEDVAIAIAKRDKARIISTGVHAQNRLGLSTQVPTKAVYLTDGSPRLIKVGKRTILFKKTSPKNLSTKGQISTLVIQALKDIGNGRVTEDEEKKVINILKKEDINNLKYDIKLAPVWIAEIMKKALTK
jgi:Family of unknown function (DUF6088)